MNHALRFERNYDNISVNTQCEVIRMKIAETIKTLREETGYNRKEFSLHTGIPLRTLEDWEAGRRTPPEYIPRLLAYQMKYEALVKQMDSINTEEKTEVTK